VENNELKLDTDFNEKETPYQGNARSVEQVYKEMEELYLSEMRLDT